jgi:hypothetical protein
MEIVASHCGSALSDTYMHLLDASKNLIVSNDDYSGTGMCSSRYHSYIKRQLTAGTYYIVSEGYSGSGNITTAITGTVPVTGVSLNTAKLSMSIKETSQLTATIIPSNATNQGVTWTSSNTDVATVSNTGQVSSRYGGTAIITVTTADGNRTAVSSVTVEGNPAPTAAVPSDDRNYIKTRTYTSDDGMYYLDAVQYYDGLGRPSQTVQAGITPSGSDLVVLQTYDDFGREDKTYLPAIAADNSGAFVTDFTSKSSSTYNNTAYNAVADAAPYSYPVYENSPLNRTLKQFGPGKNWHDNDRAIQTNYLCNEANTYPKYTVSDDKTDAGITRSGYYAAYELYVTEIKDEEGNTSYEVKDKLGQVVYIRQMDGTSPLHTAYVYDSFGNLRAILPPHAVDNLTSGSWTEDTQLFKDYVYASKYDSRNRCIAKKIPGADWVYYVYDSADRLIFSQDGEQRKTGEWSFSIPDVFGREVLSGICRNTLSYSENPLAGTTVKGERVNATNAYKGYSLSGITLTSATVLVASYYDDYNFMGYNGIPAKTDDDFRYETVSGYGEQYAGTQGYEHKGLLTGTLVACNREPLYAQIFDGTPTVAIAYNSAIQSNSTVSLQSAKYYEEAEAVTTLTPVGNNAVLAGNIPISAGNSNPPAISVYENWDYLASVMYYDDKGQLIQSKSKNHLGGVEKEYLAYNFTGQPTKRKQVHSATGKATQTEVYTCTYDHAGRQTQTKHQLNTGSETVLTDNTYDELGRLKTTKSNGQSTLETTYRYNIRSWLNGIANPLFSEDLSYNFNGNIYVMRWTQSSQRKLAYTFYYDNLSRITGAEFASNLDNGKIDLFNENFTINYEYDRHGNMTGIYPLKYPPTGGLVGFGGSEIASYAYIDHLTMDYGNSNQLRNISDSGEDVLTNPSDFKDYKKGNGVEYTYNANGAMTQDLNKGISQIQYNRLNLLQRIDIKNPVAEARNEYIYTVTGAKLKVVHRWNPAYSNNPEIGSAVNAGSMTEKVTVDYAGNKIYKNGVLEKILTENGYYENGKYYFYIRDHLGNNRIVADQTGNVEQSTQYYPFGMVMAETNRKKQAFKFGGKELDMMNGLNLYDFVARPYDPNGWFLTPDPLA